MLAKRQVRVVDEAEISSIQWGRGCYIFGRMGLKALPDEVGPKH